MPSLSLTFVRKLSRRQVFTLVVFAVAQFFNAICISLPAPFFPKEAASKGATATEFSVVFGIYELTVFFISPVVGKKIASFGAKNTFCFGLLLVSCGGITLGLLGYVKGRIPFVVSCVASRMIEAVGSACFKTACLSLIAQVFPSGKASLFSIQEVFFGLGYITGPTVGAALYEVTNGSYMAPFTIMGSCLAVVMLTSYLILPAVNIEEPSDQKKSDSPSNKEKPTMSWLLKIPWVPYAAASITSASVGIGFLFVGLERHLQRLDMSPLGVGLMFGVRAISYATSSPVFGFLCDKGAPPLLISCIGLALSHVSYALMGPVWDPGASTQMLWLQAVSLTINGFGFGAVFTSSYALLHQMAAKARGVDNIKEDLDTFGLISGLWTSSFSLGAFLGPLAAGILVDLIGFLLAIFSLPGVLTLLTLLSAGCYLGVIQMRGGADRKKSNVPHYGSQENDNPNFVSSE